MLKVLLCFVTYSADSANSNSPTGDYFFLIIPKYTSSKSPTGYLVG